MTPTVDHLNEELLSRLSDVERGQLTALLTKLAGQPT
jgi:hypothetical protein